MILDYSEILTLILNKNVKIKQKREILYVQTMHNEDVFLQIALTKKILELSIISDVNIYSIILYSGQY